MIDHVTIEGITYEVDLPGFADLVKIRPWDRVTRSLGAYEPVVISADGKHLIRYRSNGSETPPTLTPPSDSIRFQDCSQSRQIAYPIYTDGHRGAPIFELK